MFSDMGTKEETASVSIYFHSISELFSPSGDVEASGTTAVTFGKGT
jgi:hypothetical protein